MRSHRFLLPLLCLGVATALTACGGDPAPDVVPSDSPSASQSSEPSSSPSTDPTSPEVSPTSTDTPAVDPNAPEGQCADDALEVDVIPAAGGSGAGSRGLLVRFTNSGTESCVLSGYPGVSIVGHGDGTQLGQPADRSDAEISPVTLAPGDMVAAKMQAANLEGGGGAVGCTTETGDGWRVYPPHSFRAFFVPDSTVIACTDDSVFLHLVAPVSSS